MIINKLINELLDEQSVSIEQVSIETELSIDRLNEIINMKATVTPWEAEKILNVANIRLEEILVMF